MRVLFLALCLLAMSVPPALAKRVALVIANARYAEQSVLDNPPRDARTVAGALQDAGFEVTSRENLGKAQMEQAFRDFQDQARDAEVALVYFAGHGIAIDETNYIVPVDARLRHADAAAWEAIKVSDALGVVAGARRLRILIIDACRNNPYRARMLGSGTRSVAQGLRAVEPVSDPSDTIIAFSAGDGQFALDGPTGSNSPFAVALSRRLRQDGVEVGLLFRQVRDDVLASTSQRQRPFVYSSLSAAPFYFRGGPAPLPGPAGRQTVMARVPLERHPALGEWRAAQPSLLCSRFLRLSLRNRKLRAQARTALSDNWVEAFDHTIVDYNNRDIFIRVGVAGQKVSVVNNTLTIQAALNTCEYRR